MSDGDEIRIEGEGNQESGLESGDVVVVLDEERHETFVHKGNDIFVLFKLQLVEALCGFRKPLKTLDGRNLVIATEDGSNFIHQA